MSQDQQPIYILNNNIESTNGRSAQRSNIAAAKAVAEAVRSTLGPSGSDKMLVSGEGKEVVITNDGATILRQIDCQHPAGNLMISVAENQEEAAYDGTTSSVIIAGALLSESELLIQKGIHPTTICKGFREASKVALAQLKEQAKYIDGTIDPSDVDSMLDPVAKTSLTGKSAESEVDLIAQLAIEAVSKAANETSVTLDDIKIVTFAGASLSDSELLEGCLIEKDPAHTQMPPAIRGNILCLTSDLEVKEMKQDSTLSISDPNALEAFLAKEEDALKEMVNKIRDIEQGMGDGLKNGPRPEEKEMAQKGRRSLHAGINIKNGDVISKEMLVTKRPGLGINPQFKNEVIGRVAKTDIEQDDWIVWDHL